MDLKDFETFAATQSKILGKNPLTPGARTPNKTRKLIENVVREGRKLFVSDARLAEILHISASSVVRLCGYRTEPTRVHHRVDTNMRRAQCSEEPVDPKITSKPLISEATSEVLTCKAALCVAIARQASPKNATDEFIEEQAEAFMHLPDSEVMAVYTRLVVENPIPSIPSDARKLTLEQVLTLADAIRPLVGV